MPEGWLDRNLRDPEFAREYAAALKGLAAEAAAPCPTCKVPGGAACDPNVEHEGMNIITTDEEAAAAGREAAGRALLEFRDKEQDQATVYEWSYGQAASSWDEEYQQAEEDWYSGPSVFFRPFWNAFQVAMVEGARRFYDERYGGQPSKCLDCGAKIDPETCWCGDPAGAHNGPAMGHAFVAMGCECYKRAAQTPAKESNVAHEEKA